MGAGPAAETTGDHGEADMKHQLTNEEGVILVLFTTVGAVFSMVLFALPLAVLMDVCGMPPYDSAWTPLAAIVAVGVAYMTTAGVLMRRYFV